MDETIIKLFMDAIKGGYAIPFVLWFLWEKKVEHGRRKSPEWVSWKDVKILKDQMTKLEGIVYGHLEKEAEENVKIGIMDTRIGATDEKVKTETAHIFSQLTAIHLKLDSLTELILKSKQ